MTISFTRNGMLLGTAFKGILKGDDEAVLYPCVGLRTPGENIKANFGKEPFKFDISQFYSDEKERLWRQILQTSIGTNSPRPTPSCSIVNKLVVEWLVRSGYAETARSLYASSLGQAHQLDESNLTFDTLLGGASVDSRQHAMSLILNGKIKEAIIFLQQLHPKIFDLYPIIHCQLLCLEFLEMLRIQGNSMDVDESFSLADAIVYLQHVKSTFNSTPGALRDAIEVSLAHQGISHSILL
jgi:hypothetical protein